MSRFAFVALALLVASGCAPSAPAADRGQPRNAAASPLVGRWDMAGVYDRGADVTADANPAGDRYIVLRPNGSFESGGQPYGLNTGRWTYTPRTRTLALDSDLGPDDDSQWVVTLRDDVMEWDGAGSAFARRFRITAVRAR